MMIFEGAYGKRVDTGKSSGIAYGIFQLQGGTFVAAPIRVNEKHPLHDDDYDFGDVEDAHKHAIRQLADYKAGTGDWGQGGSRMPYESLSASKVKEEDDGDYAHDRHLDDLEDEKDGVTNSWEKEGYCVAKSV